MAEKAVGDTGKGPGQPATSSLTARRGKGGLQVKTEGREKPTIPITKHIERLKAGQKFDEMFKATDLIHDGGDQCRIRKVVSKLDGKEYIAKIQKKSRIRGANEAIFRRISERMLNMPDSPNVVKVMDCFEDDGYFYTVLESLQGGDLFDFFRLLVADDIEPGVLEREVRVVIREILSSLAHMHDQGMLHKDVKLENLVFKERGKLEMGSAPKRDGTVARMLAQGGTMQEPSDASPRILKLVDFDFTDEWEPSSPKSKAVVGTDGYIAPEAYLGDCCPKSDVFSTGVIMYVLVAGRFPYDDDIFDDEPGENYVGSPKMKEIHGKLRKAKVRFGRVWDHLPEAREFCSQLIDFDLNKRLDAREALRHPWMLKGV